MSVRRAPVTGRAVILVCVLALLAITLAIPVRGWLSQRSQIDRLQAEVTSTEDRVADLSARVADWQDPAYVTAQARARLHFVFPGEVGYVVLGADDRPIDPAEVTSSAESGTWFDRGWSRLRAIDEGVTPTTIAPTPSLLP